MDMSADLAATVQVDSVPQLRQSMARLWKRHGADPAGLTQAAIDLWWHSPGDKGEMARMGVAIVLGPASVQVAAAMAFMVGECADDASWRVQEALAKGLDWQCATRGWPESTGTLEDWLRHRKVNVRRAAAEGPRVWTQRGHFTQDPAEALRLLGLVRGDRSDYVVKSVGNAISDISKTWPELVLQTLEGWVAAGNTTPEMIRRACRKLQDTHAEPTGVLLAKL
jgi:hypothetical protein